MKNFAWKKGQKINIKNLTAFPSEHSPYTSTKDMAMWINKLLMEGDAGKAEKMFLR
ncbi:MAG: hypothetical protein IPH94_15860 [Saprospiraceae bacterium]|nr:hypothetical protein [Saprospiraceae bacterium]